MDKTKLVYAAVILIAASNAIKGTMGLVALQDSLENKIASVLLSIGIEALLFYSVYRMSADRSWPTAIYSSLLAVGAALLNFLFFMDKVILWQAIALAIVGPIAACIGGLVVGEGERIGKEDKHREQLHAERMARETRLTALHERRKAEASIMVVEPEPTKEYASKKEAIMAMKGKPAQEIASATGASLPYVYEVIRGSNGR